MDRLSLAALACLPEYALEELGSLSWSLGKLGSKLGAARIHPPVSACGRHLQEGFGSIISVTC